MLTALNPALRERSTLISNNADPRDGDYVLYWMHHAMRAHENPALDAAIEIGNALGKPVLVYQGLSGSHAFDSDRHHFFILQGARDVANELAQRDIAYQFFLPTTARSRSPLHALLDRAAAAVFEFMPVAPFTRWQPRMAQQATLPIIRTDARCIAPMSLPGIPVDRAFRFRDALKHEYPQRIITGWPDSASNASSLAEQDVFDALDVAQASDETLLSLIATQPIDHSIGPVADTSGGSIAGYARWEHFKRHGLKHYHRNRNDATQTAPPGVSRMSAYLHYGQVSPFRLAREATQNANSGAEKFLDELTIWRELAHHYCAQTKDTDDLRALPEWARQTLQAHANDVRPTTYSLHTLQHAHTDEPLWNLAQRSLLAHGELHNNVRMTWAKAIPQWQATPGEALNALIDLNHRYALDGNDPSSYGGLLWALGLFDRAFTPEADVIGTVRPRSVRAHAKRLDMQAYEQHVSRACGTRFKIAVIGAGVSGLAAAASLQRHHHDVTVFEKSRGPGGRTATRRNDTGFVDHGAQYFTMRDPRFVRHQQSLVQDGVIEAWPTNIDGVIRSDATRRWRGVGGMNALCKYMARDIEIRSATRVSHIEQQHSGWLLHLDGTNDSERFDVVIVSAPAPQASTLLESAHPEFARRAGDVNYAPCWALMLQCDATTPAPSWDAQRIENEMAAWIAQRRTGDVQQWVLHASPEWSKDHLEMSAEEACTTLLESFLRHTGIDASAVINPTAHRWRFGRVTDPLKCGALFDADVLIGACGDWCADSSRVEAAWLSGQAMAGRVLAAAAMRFSLQ
ncbi:MAG: FAD-dependent oxidoreductase [Pseudomonadota bacterium]